MKIRIDAYFDITCQSCGMSWSTDFNARTGTMTDGGMGLESSRSSLSRRAYAAGWKCRRGITLCPVCVAKDKKTG